MANKDQDRDVWTQGWAQLGNAVSHNITASRLMFAGTVALAAGAVAYFWDQQRRDEFTKLTRTWLDKMPMAGATSQESGPNTE